MKLYCHHSRSKKPIKADEVAIQADPVELRRIASFILHAAELMEKHQEDFGHVHLQDFEQNDHERKPDIVIAR